FFMVRECLANFSAQACDHIEYTAWQDTRDQLSKFEYGQRRLLRRLENQCVARGENWCNLPRTHEQRVVPRHDSADDSQRFSHDERGVVFHEVARAGLRERACRSRRKAENIHGTVDIITRYF